jgi:hypothetical protein
LAYNFVLAATPLTFIAAGCPDAMHMYPLVFTIHIIYAHMRLWLALMAVVLVALLAAWALVWWYGGQKGIRGIGLVLMLTVVFAISILVLAGMVGAVGP